MSQIHTFFAVTRPGTNSAVSLYKVTGKDGSVGLEKIACRGSSLVGLGILTSGEYPMLAILDHLQAFIPEGGGMGSLERDLFKVNTQYWGNRTSSIIALFLEETDARTCFDFVGQPALSPCDERWRDHTERTLQAIGKDHPHFEVVCSEGNSLIPNWKWE